MEDRKNSKTKTQVEIKTKTNYEELILNHYKKVAVCNGEAPTSSMEDQYIREAEINFFHKTIATLLNIASREKEFSLLDLGCGNGYLLSILRQKFIEAKLFGLEFTPELFSIAQNRNLANSIIVNGDAKELTQNYAQSIFSKSVFDFITTERVIINLLDKDDQKKVLKNIFHLLNKNGYYLLSESFKEPLLILNEAQRELLLPEQKESYQNLYMDEDLVSYMKELGFVEVEGAMPINYLSTHFYLTRIFHKLIRPPGGKVKSSFLVEFFREAMKPAVGNFSPILFRVFKKHE